MAIFMRGPKTHCWNMCVGQERWLPFLEVAVLLRLEERGPQRMGDVVGPMRGSGGGRDRMESSRSKD